MDRNPLFLRPEGCFPYDRAVDLSLLLVSRLTVIGDDNMSNQREKSMERGRKDKKTRERGEKRR